jgi:hypothetical protein
MPTVAIAIALGLVLTAASPAFADIGRAGSAPKQGAQGGPATPKTWDYGTSTHTNERLPVGKHGHTIERLCDCDEDINCRAYEPHCEDRRTVPQSPKK